MRHHLRRPGLAVATVVCLLGLVACGGGDESSSGAAEAPAGGVARDVAGDSGAGSGGDSGGGSGASPGDKSAVVGGAESALGASAAQAATGARQIRTAEITVEVTDLKTSAAKVRAAAAALGGTVASEVTGYRQFADQTTPEGDVTRTAAPGESVIVLRVPEPDLETALAMVAKVGEELTRSTTSQDVTGELADLDSRVKTATESVTRVRALLADASSLQDIVLLEAELTRRQADLEALQARQAALADRADLATLTAVLRTPQALDEAASGFLAGLENGWDALLTSTMVLLTIVGALLPWLAVAALIGLPLLMLLRRRRRTRRHRPPSAPSPVPPVQPTTQPPVPAEPTPVG